MGRVNWSRSTIEPAGGEGGSLPPAPQGCPEPPSALSGFVRSGVAWSQLPCRSSISFRFFIEAEPTIRRDDHTGLRPVSGEAPCIRRVSGGRRSGCPVGLERPGQEGRVPALETGCQVPTPAGTRLRISFRVVRPRSLANQALTLGNRSSFGSGLISLRKRSWRGSGLGPHHATS